MPGADLSAEVHARAIGQSDVDQGQSERGFLERPTRLTETADPGDRKTVASKSPDEGCPEGLIILDEEQAG